MRGPRVDPPLILRDIVRYPRIKILRFSGPLLGVVVVLKGGGSLDVVRQLKSTPRGRFQDLTPAEG